MALPAVLTLERAAGRAAAPVARDLSRPAVGARINFVRPARGRHGPATGTLGFELTGLELFLVGTLGLLAWTLGLFKPGPPPPAPAPPPPSPGGSGLGGPGPSITPAAGRAHGLGRGRGQAGETYDVARLSRSVIVERRSYYASSGAAKAEWLRVWLRDYTALYLAAPLVAARYERPPGWKPPAEEGPPSAETGGAGAGSTPLVVFGPEPAGPSGGKASTDTGIVGGTRLP